MQKGEPAGPVNLCGGAVQQRITHDAQELRKRVELAATDLASFGNPPHVLVRATHRFWPDRPRRLKAWLIKMLEHYLSSPADRALSPLASSLTDISAIALNQQTESSLTRLAVIEMRRLMQEMQATTHDLGHRIAGIENDLRALQLKVAGDSHGGAASDPELDALYQAFEDRHRGSIEDVQARLKAYLPFWEAISPNLRKACPAVDLGCGRGEWLALLKENGALVSGCDLNAVAVQRCQQKGITVLQQDAIAHLRGLQNGSASLISAFHVIEHLHFSEFSRLCAEAFRVLAPGGTLIFETPNPENILVSTNNFYTDPTHRAPVPKLLCQFLLEHHGFNQVEALDLHPYPEHAHLKGDDESMRRLNHYFHGPQDYGMIARKP